MSSHAVVSSLFGTRDWFRGRQFFHGQVGGYGFRMIQAHYIYCVLYFYYYYISSTLDQALDPGGWGPLDYRTKAQMTYAQIDTEANE